MVLGSGESPSLVPLILLHPTPRAPRGALGALGGCVVLAVVSASLAALSALALAASEGRGSWDSCCLLFCPTVELPVKGGVADLVSRPLGPWTVGERFGASCTARITPGTSSSPSVLNEIFKGNGEILSKVNATHILVQTMY